MKYFFMLFLTVFLLTGYRTPDNKDNSLEKLKSTSNYILFYQDKDVTIYHYKNIDTNQIFLIPASDVYIDLAYFDNKNFKTY